MGSVMPSGGVWSAPSGCTPRHTLLFICSRPHVPPLLSSAYASGRKPDSCSMSAAMKSAPNPLDRAASLTQGFASSGTSITPASQPPPSPAATVGMNHSNRLTIISTATAPSRIGTPTVADAAAVMPAFTAIAVRATIRMACRAAWVEALAADLALRPPDRAALPERRARLAWAETLLPAATRAMVPPVALFLRGTPFRPSPIRPATAVGCGLFSSLSSSCAGCDSSTDHAISMPRSAASMGVVPFGCGASGPPLRFMARGRFGPAGPWAEEIPLMCRTRSPGILPFGRMRLRVARNELGARGLMRVSDPRISWCTAGRAGCRCRCARRMV